MDERKELDYTLAELMHDLLNIMSDRRMLDHFDGFGAAIFALDLQSALIQVTHNKGYKFKPEEWEN